jgi:hypothetical protein
MATIAWVLAVLSLGYFLPWAVAATRGKSNAGAIGWLNLLLGWTFIGWVAALVMACTAHQVAGMATTLTIFNRHGQLHTPAIRTTAQLYRRQPHLFGSGRPGPQRP